MGGYHFRKTKYNNKKTTVDGIEFDSIRESKRYGVLKMMLKAKTISDLKIQVKFDLIPSQKMMTGKKLYPVAYYADFTYIREGKYIVEDVKGKKTDVYILKKKLMKFIHNIELYET